jgi:hypothetical protein
MKPTSFPSNRIGTMIYSANSSDGKKSLLQSFFECFAFKKNDMQPLIPN